jgi:hypothetical protein
MTLAEIYKACRVGAWFLAIISDHEKIVGVLVFDISAHPLGTTLNIILLAGDDADGWFPDLVKHWDWLDSMGVKRMTAEGRRGFARLFKRKLPNVRVIREVLEWDRTDAD